MFSETTPIHIRVLVEGSEYLLTTRPGEYRNLMMLIYDRIYVDGFGDCKGMGRCGTCRVLVDGDPATLSGLDRNEAATLARTDGRVTGIRLACQILIDENLHDRTITVLTP
jgi:2Fe-2S ferredoxin